MEVLHKHEDVQPWVTEGHLKAFPATGTLYLFNCVATDSGMSHLSLVFREPLGVEWMIWENRDGRKCKYYRRNSFNDEQPVA